MSENNLKSCPFCGGKAKLFVDGFGLYFTGCDECGFYYGIEIEHDCELVNGWVAKHNTQEAAVKAWNTRKPVEKIVERLVSAAVKAMENSEKAAELGKLYENHMIYNGAKGNAFEEAIEIVKEVDV